MKKEYWIAIGVLVGMILVKILYPLIGRFTENMSSNKVTDKQVQAYIDRSKHLQLQFSSYKSGYTAYDNIMYTKDVMRSYYLFYDTFYKKYFSIQMFDTYALNGILDEVKNTPITCFVNTDQLNNPVYGTEKNPIPVLRCDIAIKNEWKESHSYGVMDYKKFTNDYRAAVYNNLKYFTPKDEFKKMFPEAK